MTATVHVGFDPRDFRARAGKLVISDPEGQEGLLPVVAKGTKPVTFLNWYETAETVHCAFCDTHQRHKRGFTVGLEGGEIALCGRNCAEDFFGRDVTRALHKDLQVRIDREKRKETAERTFAGMDDLALLVSDELVKQEKRLRELCLQLRRTMPEAALKTLVAGNVRGVAARALEFYVGGPVSANLQGFLRAMKKAQQDPEGMTDKVLERAAGIRQRILRAIDQLATFFDEARALLSERNIPGLIAYQNANRESGIVVSFRRPKTGPELQIKAPGEEVAHFQMPKVPAFDRLHLIGLLNGHPG